MELEDLPRSDLENIVQLAREHPSLSASQVMTLALPLRDSRRKMRDLNKDSVFANAVPQD